VDDRGHLLDAQVPQQFRLQKILVIEDDGRHRGPVRRPIPPPAVRERGSGGGYIAQRSQRLNRAALHGVRIARDRGERGTAAQQLL
jgi:hypothetical protein